MVGWETPMAPLTHQRREAQTLLTCPSGKLLLRHYWLCRIPSASFLVSGTSPFPFDLAALYTYLHFSNYNICLLVYLSSQLYKGKDSIFFISCIPRSWHILCTKKKFVLRLTLEPEMFKSPKMYNIAI